MRSLLVELQEFLKRRRITASLVSCGGSGDMGLSEGRKTSTLFISKPLPDDVCMSESCRAKAFLLAWYRHRDVGFRSKSWQKSLLFYHLLVCDHKRAT